LSRYGPENYCAPTPGSPIAEKEILETVTPDEQVLAACRRMKEQGYRLALDDYLHTPETERFLAIADFVKIDVLLTTFPEQQRLVDVCHHRNIPVIAEKVETNEQFRRRSEIGYDYFQGYFFCRPQVVGRKSVPANKLVARQAQPLPAGFRSRTRL
jgi:c-di-GMP-related signal transduction protein